VPHAKHEELVLAVGVARGTSVCETHKPRLARVHSAAPHAECAYCLPTVRPAFFVLGDRPLCIRHAADSAFPDDDMGAHDMAHAAYQQLGKMGVRDAY
jgi:hypothetical protein